MIQIFSSNGNVLKDEIHSFTYNGEFMGSSFITTNVENESPIDFTVGDYCIFRGERFELNYTPAKGKYSSNLTIGNGFRYENLKFNSLSDELTRCEFIDVVLADNGSHFTSKPDFSFYASSVKDLTDRIQANLNRVYTGSKQWTINIAPKAISPERNITISKSSVWSALSLVHKEFGLNFTIRNRVITVGAAGSAVGRVFGYGEGNGLYDIRQNTNEDALLITRLRAYGSTKNIPYRYYNELKDGNNNPYISESVYIDSLMLPDFPRVQSNPADVYLDSDNISKYGIREGSVYFDGSDSSGLDIYPSIEGMTKDLLAAAGIAVSLPAGDNGNIDEVLGADNPTDDGIIPAEGSGSISAQFVVYLKDLGFDLSERDSSGQYKYATDSTMQISMKTGLCVGRTFDIVENGIEKDTTLGYTRFKVTCNRFTDNSVNMAYPNSTFTINSRDKFVILGISMPEVYIQVASQKLLVAAQEYLAQNDESKYTYIPTISSEFMARNPSIANNIKEGDILSFSDDDLGIDASSIIQTLKITHTDNSPIPTYDVVLNDSKISTTVEKLQDSINSLATNQTGVTIEQVRSLVQSVGTAYFLSRTHDDTASGNMSFLQNVSVTKDLGVQGNIISDGKVTADQFGNDSFTSGQFGSGFRTWLASNGQSYAEVDNLLVRREMLINTLSIAEIKSVGGQILLSLADMLVSNVTDGGTYWKVSFNNDNGTISNRFDVDDQVICRKFNGASVKYYWARVTSIGVDYINISKTDKDGSGVPEPGDEIIQFGNRTKTARQSAIMLSAYGSDAPSIKQYAEINSYNLANKEVTVISPSGNKFKGSFEISTNGTTTVVYKDRGIFVNGQTYYVNDRVSYSGSYWVCLINNTSATPSLSSSSWRQDTVGDVNIENAINSIRIGGANLIDGSSFEDGIGGSAPVNGATISRVTEGYDGNYCMKFVTADRSNSGYSWRMLPTVEDQQYVMSLYLKSDSPISGVRFAIFDSSWNIIESKLVNTINDWSRFDISFIAKGSDSIVAVTISNLISELYVDCLQLETGNIVTDWSLSSSDINKQIAKAQADAIDAKNLADSAKVSADTANALLADIASDNKLTPSEKQDVKKEWDIITSEYSILIAQANSYSVSTTTYTNAYNSLNSYLSTLLSNMSTTSNIVGTVFRNNFKNYYDARTILLNSVSDKTKAIADESISLANNAQAVAQAAKQTADSAQIAANSAQTSANAANALLSDIASDNKLTPSEKQDTKKEWDIIVSEYPKIIAQANSFSVSTSSYSGAYASLNNYLTPLLGNLNATSNITGTSFRTTFKNYYDAKINILNAISTEAKRIADSAQSSADSAIIDAENAKNLANAANSTANAAKAAADLAKTDADKANSLLSDIASDNKLTPTEKHDTKKEWDIIASEYSSLLSQANSFAVSTISYTQSYNTLNGYITPLLSNLSTTSNITGTTFRSNFKNYYDARTALLNAISTKAKNIADAAQIAANNAMNEAEAVRSEYQADFVVLNDKISSKVSQGDFNALGNRVSTTESNITQLSGSITSVVETVENISIGGKNLINGSSFEVNIGNSATVNGSTIERTPGGYNGYYCMKVLTSNVNSSGYVWNNLPTVANKKYVASMYLKGESAISGARLTIGTSAWVAVQAITIDITTEWTRFDIPFTSNGANMRFYITVSNNPSTFYVDCLQLEEGNMLTSWSLSPGDIESQINEVKTDASNAQSTANLKNRTYYQDTTPTVPSGGHRVGDLWSRASLVDSAGNVNTDTTKNIYQLQYRWNGTTWQQINWSASRSKIEQTDSSIATIVEKTGMNSVGAGQTLYSIINQTADEVRLEVSSISIGVRNLYIKTRLVSGYIDASNGSTIGAATYDQYDPNYYPIQQNEKNIIATVYNPMVSSTGGSGFLFFYDQNKVYLGRQTAWCTGGVNGTTKTGSTLYNIPINAAYYRYSTIHKDLVCKIEYGNKATYLTPAPEDTQFEIDKAQDAADLAQSNADTANALLSNIASDNKLTPSEKHSTKKEWDVIVSEYSKNISQANYFSVATASYTNAYNTLSSYITPLLSNLTTTSDIVGSTFRTRFKSYYDAVTDLLNAISTKNKSIADSKTTLNEVKAGITINTDGVTAFGSTFTVDSTLIANAIQTESLNVGGNTIIESNGTLKTKNAELEGNLTMFWSGDTGSQVHRISMVDTSSGNEKTKVIISPDEIRGVDEIQTSSYSELVAASGAYVDVAGARPSAIWYGRQFTLQPRFFYDIKMPNIDVNVTGNGSLGGGLVYITLEDVGTGALIDVFRHGIGNGSITSTIAPSLNSVTSGTYRLRIACYAEGAVSTSVFIAANSQMYISPIKDSIEIGRNGMLGVFTSSRWFHFSTNGQHTRMGNYGFRITEQGGIQYSSNMSDPTPTWKTLT